jgi:hypothetical protein
MSTSDATHTFPSIEDVAMYMALDGVFGRICCRGVLCAADVEDPDAIDAESFWACDTALCTASDFATLGGGNGEMDIEEIDAEWA